MVKNKRTQKSARPMKRRKKREEMREALLAAAAELFQEQGIETTTFAQIAARVGVTQPYLYAHFSNKMDLLEKVILWSAVKGRAYIDGSIDEKMPAIQRLRAYVNANFTLFYDFKVHAHSIGALYYFAISSHPINKLFHQVLEMTLKRIETYLIQVHHELAKADFDAVRMAAEVHIIIIGGSYRVIHSRNAEEAENIQKSCWKMIEDILFKDS